ncbi:hypothetical protein HYH03_003838 [Edaphochlamys debaryana]|uniref:Uncharacterized protein n=2 Tax=Edaphochlamys debaryana TaxID=47281 RepID=A0A835YI54_9CHLO|nr:hypothetical protein HYH03_003838 [Edaphochlamys debaryana]|eukprot:KAG2498079.1 hypothetical protein HYH03_003838 [Edaphochlamys debaryana]
MFHANKLAPIAGGVKKTKKAKGHEWGAFNKLFRACKLPTREAVSGWYDANASQVWTQGNVPSIEEVMAHATQEVTRYAYRKRRAEMKAKKAQQGGKDGSKAAQAAVSHSQPAATAAPAKRRLDGACAEQQQGPRTKRPCLGPLPPPSAGVPLSRKGPIAPQPPAAPAAAPAILAPAPHPHTYGPGYPCAPPPHMAQAGWGQPLTYPYAGPYAYQQHNAYQPYAYLPYAYLPYASYLPAPFHAAPAPHSAPSAAPSRSGSGAVAGYPEVFAAQPTAYATNAYAGAAPSLLRPSGPAHSGIGALPAARCSDGGASSLASGPQPPALEAAWAADLEAASGDAAVIEVLDFLESDGEGDSPPRGPASASARAGREAARTPAKAPCSRASAPGPTVSSPNVLSPFKEERMEAAATHCLVRKLLLGEEGEEEVPCSPAARQALPELALLVGLIARDDAAGR